MVRTVFRKMVLAGWILLGSGCSITEGRGSTFVRAFSFRAPETSVVHKQFNFHRIAPGIWRSSQPTHETLDRMRQYNLKSIVNLRMKGEAEDWESRYARENGIRFFHFPMNAEEKQDPAQLKEILATIRDPQNQPVLIHCAAGKDRTGLVTALYRTQVEDKSLAEAEEEMLMYGYDEKNYPELFATLRNWK